MGFLFTYLICFFGAIIIHGIYARYKVQKNIAFISTRSAIFLIFFWIIDTLLIFGVLDPVLIYLNNIPGVFLPVQNTGLYYYYNCLLLGVFNLGIPVQSNYGFILLAIIMETAYISFYKNGLGIGKFLFGKNANQKGTIQFFMPLQKPKNWKEMEKKWKAETAQRDTKDEEVNKIIEEGLELAKKLGLKDKIKGFKS